MAAEQGLPEAQYNLGTMYALGQGVPEDLDAALHWYRSAAEQGNPAARYNLGLMHSKGHGVPIDFVKAVSWYRNAAEEGFALAQFQLSLQYIQGHGVGRDLVRAYMWLDLAAAGDRQPWAAARDKLGKEMSPEQIAEARRMARVRLTKLQGNK